MPWNPVCTVAQCKSCEEVRFALAASANWLLGWSLGLGLHCGAVQTDPGGAVQAVPPGTLEFRLHYGAVQKL